MAADGAEGFEARVKRLFGSGHFGSVPAATSWSVAAGDVERHRWARPSELRDAEETGAGRADTPCASSFYDANGCLRSRRRRSKQDFEGDLDDEDEDEEEGEGEKRQEDEEEEAVRVSIGLDPTLDREEEEDKYDREALGRGDAADRVYMKDIMDSGPNMSIHTIVPDLLEDSVEEVHPFCRDPRADRMAALARMREDDDSADRAPHSTTQIKECPVGSQARKAEDDINLKPILKRREDQDDPKPRKRVRFDPGVKDQLTEPSEHSEDSPMVPQSMDVVTESNLSIPSECPGVPDYVRNPSKYTRYTLDAPECNDESNKRALADLHALLGGTDPNKLQPETPVELPSSVTFIPRKKTVDAMAVDEGPKSSNANSSFVGLAAAASDETDQCEMDEDDGQKASSPQVHTNSKTNSRCYRSSAADD